MLRNLVSAVRPVGFLLVEEDDTYPIEATATGAYRRAWDTFVAMTVKSGLDPHWARGLPERLGELEDPRRWFHGPAKFSVWGRRPV